MVCAGVFPPPKEPFSAPLLQFCWLHKLLAPCQPLDIAFISLARHLFEFGYHVLRAVEEPYLRKEGDNAEVRVQISEKRIEGP